MALPSFKLAAVVARAAKNHGKKLKNINNQEALVQDLSDCLNSQLSTLKDPHEDNISTLISLLPQIVEMKVFTAIVAKRLNIDTKGKGQFEKLDTIVKEMESMGSDAADELKEALEWSKSYLTSPEMVDILNSEKASVQLPEKITVKSVLSIFPQTAMAIKDNMSQLNGFITIAKTKEKEDRKARRQEQLAKAKKDNPKNG